VTSVDEAVDTLLSSSVCKSGYPLSINFMAAKNPDILKKSENPAVSAVCKNCVNCASGIVAVL